jgi:hypothetical protein
MASIVGPQAVAHGVSGASQQTGNVRAAGRLGIAVEVEQAGHQGLGR